jgi:hypothetical protein
VHLSVFKKTTVHKEIIMKFTLFGQSFCFSILSVLCFVQVVVAQTETTPPNHCPSCFGTIGTWNVTYPWNSQYSYVRSKSERKLVWGSLSSVIRNPPAEGAQDITRTTSENVSFSYNVSDSGSRAVSIKAGIGTPKTGSIGGGFSDTSTWTAGVNGSSERGVQVGRVCSQGYAIWERAYYYSKEDTGTEYRYNSGLSAQYWCPVVSCQAYTRTGSFTDIYDESRAVFVYPSGEAGMLTLTGPWDTDVQSSSYYTLTPLFTDVNIPAKVYSSGKNW